MKKNNFSILYVGPLIEGGTCLMRMQTLEKLGHNVFGLDTLPYHTQWINKLFLYKVYKNIFSPVDLPRINCNIIKSVKQLKPDIIWIDKGLIVKKSTLITVKNIDKNIFILSYSPDDMLNPENQSSAYLQSLPLYDLHVTTKSYNVNELLELGAKKVMMVGNAYNPAVHRPVKITKADKRKLGGSVGFIGAYEKERAEVMYCLADAGIKVRIWGMGWGKNKRFHRNLIIENISIWGDDYTRTICSFDINLCFLRKVNRDLQTTRSIEIPACGAFMLAERTDEHLQLFEEGKEAEFFGTTQELINKVKFYISHEKLRTQIARAGMLRCHKSGYDYSSKLREILSKVEAIKTNNGNKQWEPSD